jgi:hypothetical protein
VNEALISNSQASTGASMFMKIKVGIRAHSATMSIFVQRCSNMHGMWVRLWKCGPGLLQGVGILCLIAQRRALGHQIGGLSSLTMSREMDASLNTSWLNYIKRSDTFI